MVAHGAVHAAFAGYTGVGEQAGRLGALGGMRGMPVDLDFTARVTLLILALCHPCLCGCSRGPAEQLHGAAAAEPAGTGATPGATESASLVGCTCSWAPASKLRQLNLTHPLSVDVHARLHAAFGLPAVRETSLPTSLSSFLLPRQMDPHGELWGRLRAAIGQPNF